MCLHGAVGPGRTARMRLYADVEISFLAARVLLHGVFLLPEYHHLLSNATIVYLGFGYPIISGDDQNPLISVFIEINPIRRVPAHP